MSELSERDLRKVHLVTYEGVDATTAEDFLCAMEAAGADDPEGYASFLVELDARIARAREAAETRGAARNARSAIESALRSASGRPTPVRVREIQGALAEHVMVDFGAAR